MKRLLLLIAVFPVLTSASRAGEEIPVYPLSLDLWKPMVDSETFHYWNIPGMEVWFEITEASGGAATLTCCITFL
ncbi:MAG: hypothetical protein NTW26_07675 [bacterium]|nr:hypothetical protein [bacterium]